MVTVLPPRACVPAPLRATRIGTRRTFLKQFPIWIHLYSERCSPALSFSRCQSGLSKRTHVIDGRARLSNLWIPTGGIAESAAEDSHSRLLRAGFLRQAHSGLYHMLPLGRRVQDKLEALIDKYMSKLGASKLALSSISSEEIWTRSGRLKGANSEIFQFKDRKGAGYLLSPTHEEEITSLVSSTVKSYRELPVRLYQITRKYRDELRPRQGLLRSREFVMKDLYTFDYSAAFALETYHEVREAYAKLFDELKIPYLVADADSGDMGGNLSHEFHFPTSKGEDNVISCTTCNYVANEELAESAVQPYGGSGQEDLNSLENENAKAQGEGKSAIEPRVWRGISRDRNTLINIWYASGSDTSRGMPGHPELNLHAVKAILPEFDASIEDPMSLWTRTAGIASTKHEVLRLVNLVDCRLPYHSRVDIESQNPRLPFWPEELNCQFPHINMETLSRNPLTGRPLNLLRIRDGDPCARCSAGVLKVQKAIELGHTFYLGTRYSDPLDATVTVPGHLLKDKDHSLISSAERSDSSPDQKVPMQMGCHGIGVSRMIAAVADTLADEKGLNWPRVMAPFEVVVVPGNGLDHAASEVYDALSSIPSTSGRPQLDVILDDRTETFPWKMRDADLVGYPVIVVVGRRWKADRICEVQCRRLQVRQDLPLGEIRPFVASLLDKL